MMAATSEDEEDTEPELPNIPAQLTAVKSAEVRCSGCSKLLAEVATPPYRLTCSRCKEVVSAA